MIIREGAFFDVTRYTALLQINIFCRKPRIQTKNRKTLQQKIIEKDRQTEDENTYQQIIIETDRQTERQTNKKSLNRQTNRGRKYISTNYH